MQMILLSDRIRIRKLSPAEKRWVEQHPTRRYHIPETMLDAVKRALGKRDTLSLICALGDDYCAQVFVPLRPEADELDGVVDAVFALGLIERLTGQSDLLVIEGGGNVQ